MKRKGRWQERSKGSSEPTPRRTTIRSQGGLSSIPKSSESLDAKDAQGYPGVQERVVHKLERSTRHREGCQVRRMRMDGRADVGERLVDTGGHRADLDHRETHIAFEDVAVSVHKAKRRWVAGVQIVDRSFPGHRHVVVREA